jgi:alpha-ribazole phosphatase
MKIYLVRHTAVDIPQGMCYGQTDVPLKDIFEKEAAIVKNNLKNKSFDTVFSSPLSRCRRLAHFCGYNAAILDDRLKELFFGDWETHKWDEIDMSIWETDWINISTPNGESFIQMYDRVSSFFDDLKKDAYRSAIVFTHGGVISCARVYFEKADIKETFDLMPQYGEIVEFDL